jgi:hypothetical protein
LFGQWHRYKDGTIDWPTLQQGCRPIQLAFVATLQRVVELDCQRGERTPWAKTIGTCRQLLQLTDGLWTFLEIKGIEPTNNAALNEVFSVGVRALRPSVIQRKIRDLPSNSHGVQSRQGAICRSRGHHNPATTRPGYLAVSGTGMDCPSPQRGDAITAAG